MGAGIQRWWRDPDRLQHECDVFDGKEPVTSDLVKWWQQHIVSQLPPLEHFVEPQFEAPPPIDDSITITFRSWMYWCSTCRCYDSWPHHAHGIFTVD